MTASRTPNDRAGQEPRAQLPDPTDLERQLLSLMAGPGARPWPRTHDPPPTAARFVPTATSSSSKPLASRSTRPTLPAGSRSSTMPQPSSGAAGPPWARNGVARSGCCMSDGSPMRHDECPMAIALREKRAGPRRPGHRRPPGRDEVRFVAYPTPLFDDADRLIGAVNVLVDVTERHRAEEASRSRRGRWRHPTRSRTSSWGSSPTSFERRSPRSTGTRGCSRSVARTWTTVKASMLEDMVADADRLHSIIENLLHLTRLGSGYGTRSRAICPRARRRTSGPLLRGASPGQGDPVLDNHHQRRRRCRRDLPDRCSSITC